MPTSDALNPYGRIITRRDVALAFVSLLQTWVPQYISAVEAQAGLPVGTIPMPPDKNLSYRQGLDWDTWEQSWSPGYIVNPQPFGRPERAYGEGQYAQEFEVEICCNVVMTNQMTSLTPQASGAASFAATAEDSAIQYADMYGMAAAAAILQHGAIGYWPDGSPVSLKTTLETYPTSSFPYPEERRVVRNLFTVHAIIDYVLREGGGPTVPQPDPHVPPSDWTTVQTTNETVVTVPVTGVVP